MVAPLRLKFGTWKKIEAVFTLLASKWPGTPIFAKKQPLDKFLFGGYIQDLNMRLGKKWRQFAHIWASKWPRTPVFAKNQPISDWFRNVFLKLTKIIR